MIAVTLPRHVSGDSSTLAVVALSMDAAVAFGALYTSDVVTLAGAATASAPAKPETPSRTAERAPPREGMENPMSSHDRRIGWSSSTVTASTLPATSERDLDSLEVTPSACNPDTWGAPSFSAAASAAATPPFLKDADVGRE